MGVRAVLGAMFALAPSALLACGSNASAPSHAIDAAANDGPPADAAGGTDGHSLTEGGADSGASDGGAASDGAPIPLGNLCPLFTQDLCTYLMQCQMAPYRDINHCLAEVDCYGLPQLLEAADGGAVLYDPSTVGACDARFRADPCNFGFFLFTPDIFEVLAYCPGSITPKLNVGDKCLSSGECVSGLHCNKTSGLCPGTCTAYATNGQPCTGSGFQSPDAGYISCASGLQCNSNNVCQPNGSVGSPCKTNSDCGPIVICINDPTCQPLNLWCDKTAGTCAASVAAGAACGPTDAGTPTCADGTWCQPATPSGSSGTCTSVGGAGATCTNLGGCQTGLHCAGYQFTTSFGHCAAPGDAGSACSAASDCSTGLACIYSSTTGSTCSQRQAVGGSCSYTAQCQQGLTCSGGMCLNARYPGDSCADPMSQCVLSLCRNGTCVDHAKVGQPCSVGTDCTTGACIGGTCADTSVCANPGDGG
jgi:hypothetical protein